MSVHLIYRTPYNQQNNKFYRKFPETSVIEWFRGLWNHYDENSIQFYQNISRYIGIEIYGFWGPCRAFDTDEGFEYKSNEIPPDNFESIEKYLRNGYTVEVDLGKDNYFQVYTDDDELGLAYYVFDDSYVEANPIASQYLIQEDYDLPDSFSIKMEEARFEWSYRTTETKGENGRTFFLCSNHGGADNLIAAERNLVSIEGIRLPDLFEYIIKENDPDLVLFRIFAKHSLKETIVRISNFGKFWCLNYNEFYKYFSYEELQKITPSECYFYFLKAVEKFEKKMNPKQVQVANKSGDPKFQFSKHFIQISFKSDSWESVPILNTTPSFLYDHYIVFDDLWASSNAILAKSLINFFQGWKILK